MRTRNFRAARALVLLMAAAAFSCGAQNESARNVDAATDSASIEASADTADDSGETDALPSDDAAAPVEPVTLRVATYNLSLFRSEAGALAGDLAGGSDAQAIAAGRVIAAVSPDIILLNEFDVDLSGTAVESFITGYLDPAFGEGGAGYAHYWVAPSNTGLHSGVDLDGNGRVVTDPGSQDYAGDCYGFGLFEGQYGFAVLSRYPIDEQGVRTFQRFLWRDMPGALLPDDAATPDPGDYYSAEALDVFRLSSKNHAVVPVEVDGRVVNILASHPTPPSFDGPEDRNGRRNHDEIVFWTHVIDNAAWLTDDAGATGGLADDAHFVIMGDLNNDPFDPAGNLRGIQTLLDHPRVSAAPVPTSEGGREQSELQARANNDHTGDSAHDTADFSDGQVGNLRVDYVLASTSMAVVSASVFWPLSTDPAFEWVGVDPFPVSDHRLVWLDLEVP